MAILYIFDLPEHSGNSQDLGLRSQSPDTSGDGFGEIEKNVSHSICLMENICLKVKFTQTVYQ